MLRVVLAKSARAASLARLRYGTGDAALIEGDTWYYQYREDRRCERPSCRESGGNYLGTFWRPSDSFCDGLTACLLCSWLG
jgi:hypothetical protein